MFDQCCICVFASQTPGNIVFDVLVSLPFQKHSTCHVYLQLWPMLYLCICVFVFVYLQVKHPATLFLRSWYHYLFKNIAHVMSICNFDQCCICVFVYLCICICVFASQTPRNIVSEVLLPLPFQKYCTCHVYLHISKNRYLDFHVDSFVLCMVSTFPHIWSLLLKGPKKFRTAILGPRVGDT